MKEYIPAFPQTTGPNDGSINPVGISILDYFACFAMCAMLSRPQANNDQIADDVSNNLDKCAYYAYDYAEAMMRERLKRQKHI